MISRAATSVRASFRRNFSAASQLTSGYGKCKLFSIVIDRFDEIPISIDSIEPFLEFITGNHLFKGSVADDFLSKQGLSWAQLDDGKWTTDADMADKVAAAVLEWAQHNGAHVYCHWFQPMAGVGVR
jgi:glutamine synthetase type III